MDYSREAKPAQPATIERQTALTEHLHFDDRQDFENATRGLVAPVPNDGVVTNERGTTVWNLQAYQFLDGEEPINTINPSLLRMSRLNMSAGLFKVTDKVYQVRGMDLANMTIIEGDGGLIIIDCLTTADVAEAALALYYAHRPHQPVAALLYTHSHVDHFGGARGVVDQALVDAGETRVFAPNGFLEAIGENVLAGNAMARRAQFQFGPLLNPGPCGQVDAGLGKVTARGRVTLVTPTDVIANR